jgi:hypothetical protein
MTWGVLEWCQGWRPQKLEVVNEAIVHQKSGWRLWTAVMVNGDAHRQSAIVEGFRVVGVAGLGKLVVLGSTVQYDVKLSRGEPTGSRHRYGAERIS